MEKAYTSVSTPGQKRQGMVSIDEVRAEFHEAFKRGERDAVENYLGFIIHSAIREVLADPAVRGILSKCEKRAVVPPWKNPDEKAAADDVMDLACVGYAFDGENPVKVKKDSTFPIPEIDTFNLRRICEEKPSELAALLFGKIEKLSGKYPEGVLGKLSDNVVGSICYGIDKGVSIKEDILVLSQALVEAGSESME